MTDLNRVTDLNRRHQIVWDRMVSFGRTIGVKVEDKSASKLMWFAYYALLMPVWNPNFMTQYATGGLGRAWVPRDWFGTDAGWRVLAHEMVHNLNHQRRGVVISALGYGFPQIFAILGLFGFLGIAWWPLYFLFLLIPLFLVPLIPAVWRVEEEMIATAMSVAVLEADLLDVGHTSIDLVAVSTDRINSILGAGYFWPALLRGKAYRERLAADLRQRAELLKTSGDPVYSAVLAALAEAKRLG